MPTIRVVVPATSANLGPGFDALGLALGIYNEVEVSLSDRPHLIVHGEGQGLLPEDEGNLVYQAARAVADAVGEEVAFHLCCWNRIPVSRGLGSSAAAIVGGVVGANEVLGRPLDRSQLVSLAARLEGHPDNVVPALVGGITAAVMEDGKAHWVQVPARDLPAAVVAIPEFEVPTALARKRLPDRVSREDAVFNVGRTALLVGALAAGRWDLLAVATEDRLHQPYRKPLVPGFEDVCAAARKAGALGVVLSGAGPSLLAFAPWPQAPQVGEAMQAAFAAHGVRARAVVARVDLEGTRVQSHALRR
ncbi:MAG: homoserine kinase [Armatimonadota bacterium]|nr:homoserine kinase [Armatimonadota bacterium]MDR7443646.1 homoserine kinase [Armatimonadota bacterium]MDR7570221.1 homoserine kinase [Armatimonadota bacterium]MDR7613824.1 homoserine kinase [Armatimonadota bacterium]